jgi:hypothetical protein
MSADAVTVERCTLRIVRRGGWSWGPNPRGLLDAAVRALPWLIARELSRLIEQNADGEIGEPVQLAVRTSGDAIAAAAAMVTSGDAFCLERSALVLDMARAMRANAALASKGEQSPPEDTALPNLARTGSHTSALRPIGVRLLEWLKRRHEQGELGRVLHKVPPDVLDAWHGWLFPRAVTDVSSPHVDAAIAALAGLASASPSGAATSLAPDAVKRRRLATAVRAAAELRIDSTEEVLRTAICRLIPLDEPSARSPIEPETPGRPATAGAIRPLRTVARSRPSSSRQAIDLDNLCALPFLLLGPLQRIGYLDTAALALPQGAVLQTFAAGLAMKGLPPASRGWRRDGRATSTAAAFAGLESHVDDAAVHELAGASGTSALELLDDVVARELTQGHLAGTPVLVVAARGETLIVDFDGAFVIAASDAVGAIADALKGMSGQWVAVPADTASPGLTATLRDAGVTFVTDARPGRGDRWNRAPRWPNAERSWWATGETPPPVAMLVRIESEAELADRTRALWQALQERPAVPRHEASALERSLAVAAAFALGTIAWNLWRGRERVDPLLALERFATLDARVALKDDEIRVRLPLGTRYLDLERHGLLADVRGIPWLGGRAVVFSGG